MGYQPRGVSAPVSLLKGGFGASNANVAAARTSIAAAGSGTNTDITTLNQSGATFTIKADFLSFRSSTGSGNGGILFVRDSDSNVRVQIYNIAAFATDFAYDTSLIFRNGYGGGVAGTFDNSGDLTIGSRVIVGAPAARVGGSIFDHYGDGASTHTDGTEDTLYTDTTVANTLSSNGGKIHGFVYLNLASSATAARRIKQYFGGTLIFDSGSLTLSLGGDFSIYTEIIRESSTVVRCVVSVTTTSASTVPYSTYTRITGLTLSSTNILKTTGIASGTGAASGDITAKHAWIQWMPAA